MSRSDTSLTFEYFFSLPFRIPCDFFFVAFYCCIFVVCICVDLFCRIETNVHNFDVCKCTFSAGI